jgi:hypothetical protein
MILSRLMEGSNAVFAYGFGRCTLAAAAASDIWGGAALSRNGSGVVFALIKEFSGLSWLGRGCHGAGSLGVDGGEVQILLHFPYPY